MEAQLTMARAGQVSLKPAHLMAWMQGQLGAW